MNLNEVGEFGFIERLRENLSSSDEIALSIGDDAAILKSLAAPTISCDALIEGVHFRRDWTSARDLGWKALCVNLSDLAAMGARPVAALIALSLPRNVTLEWLDEFYAGLNHAAVTFGCPLVGGDTTRAPHDIHIALTVIGELPAGRAPLRRAAAQMGDLLLLSGETGEAAAGLWALQHPEIALPSDVSAKILARHFRPTPRLRESEALRESLPADALRACLDISDGLAGDARHIALASQVTLHIDSARLPLSVALHETAARAEISPLAWALGGGEDYELLWSIAPEFAHRACEILENCGARGTIIGRVVAREDAAVMMVDDAGKRQSLPPAWTHF